MSPDAQFGLSLLKPVFQALVRAGGWVHGDSLLVFPQMAMVRTRWIGDGLLQELEQYYIQAMYRYNEDLQQGPRVVSKACCEMVRLEVDVRRLRYGH